MTWLIFGIRIFPFICANTSRSVYDLKLCLGGCDGAILRKLIILTVVMWRLQIYLTQFVMGLVVIVINGFTFSINTQTAVSVNP